VRIDHVILAVADPAVALDAWLGPHDLDVRTVPGAPPGPRRVAIALRGGGAILL
jgi:hypothetical protein